MSHKRTQWLSLLLMCVAMFTQAQGQVTKSDAPDLTKQQLTLYVVPYAHLDTQWRWEYPQVIREYLTKTMRDNFALFEKYPNYVFNFSGANRYRLMKEYYPEDYAKLKQYVAAGRWFPSGSSMEENDVNNPSAESIIRQILYGKEYFRRDFGKTSAEYMLPDCFGFPASLPSILAHTGLKGFSTQKLSWHSGAPVGGPDSPEKTPIGIPFNVGYWEGLDGKGVVAALNAMDYSGDVTYDLSKSPLASVANAKSNETDWPKRIAIDGQASGLFADYFYYGTGDTGGSPREDSVRLMDAILTRGWASLPSRGEHSDDTKSNSSAASASSPVLVGDGPVKVIQTTAEQMFLDIKPEQIARLPRYKGDLELTEHSAGSLTSEAYLRRWNRENERLADAAERASVAAQWLGGRLYPQKRLTDAWTLVMGGQFHDIIPGTSTPKAYEYAWNDQVLAMNQFAGVLTSATEAIASGLDTQTKGTAVVVYNPLNIVRDDVAEANISFPNGTPKAVRVLGADGKEVPAQLSGTRVLFLAKVPSVGYAVYDVQPAEAAAVSPVLKVSESSLENARYLIKLDQNGDVSSIFDKKLKRELLSAPARLAIKTDRPVDWPAWNMDWADQQQPPRAFVHGPAKVRIVESGPVRVAVEISRQAEDSNFVQTIRLAAGDAGNRVEFANSIDWKTSAANIKATFPLTASNPLATYNWDIGTIQRGNDNEKKYEVASHQWFDLTDKSGAYGVTILTGAKNGSDKPDDNTLRLTLVRTPGIGTGNGSDYSDQATQDWGHHDILYGLAGHAGDWRQEQTDWQAWRLDQPLIAFEASKHPGALEKTFSLLHLNNSRVRVLAIKKAEQSDEIVVRLVEISGKPEQNVHVAFAAPITAARQINGAEEAVGAATVSNGELVTDFSPYQPRTFALKLGAAPFQLPAPHSQTVELPFDRSVTTSDGRPAGGSFDEQGRALAAEALPTEVAYDGIHFALAPVAYGKPNAVIPSGQVLSLPAGFNHLYILAAAEGGDQQASFRVGDNPVELNVEDWGGYIGQWDSRTWKQVQVPLPPEPAPGDNSRAARRAIRIREYVKKHGPIMKPEYTGLNPGFIKRAPVAWFASHNHAPEGANEPYQYSYLFAYRVAILADAKTLTLPNNDHLRILAITAAKQDSEVEPAQPLYDTLDYKIDPARYRAAAEAAH